MRNQAQHSWMVIVIKLFNLLIAAIHRNGILNQIVRTDGEKVRLLRKDVCQHCRSRHLNHHAKRNLRVERQTFVCQFLARLCCKLLCRTQLLNRRDHGKHDPERSVYAGTVKRPELGLEQLRIIQANADRTITEKRIFFRRDLQHCGRFVSADVQRPYGHRAVLRRLQCSAVDRKLFLLRRQLRPVHIKKLAAEQTNTVSPARNRVLDLRRRGDIGFHLDHGAVLGTGFAGPICFKCLLPRGKYISLV